MQAPARSGARGGQTRIGPGARLPQVENGIAVTVRWSPSSVAVSGP